MNSGASTVARGARTGEAVRHCGTLGSLRPTGLAVEAAGDPGAEITYGLALHCQSDKAKPRHMDGAFYETIACLRAHNAKRVSAARSLM